MNALAMTKFKRLLVFIVVVLTGLIFGFFMMSANDHEPVKILDRLGIHDFQNQSNTESSKALSAAEKKFESKAKENQSSSLIDIYNKASNGRAFVLSAWSLPNQGGRFYASKMADQCSGVRNFSEIIENPQINLANIRPENQIKATESAGRLFALCGQFTEEELKKYSSSSLFSNVDENDKLVNIHRKIENARNSDDKSLKRQAVVEVMGIADPLLVDSLGARISMDSRNGGIYFDGKIHKLKDSEELLAAYYLLPCGLGLNCGVGDPMLAVSCASGAACYDSRFSKVKAEMVGGNNEKYERVLKLYESMVLAFKNKDSSFFVPPLN